MTGRKFPAPGGADAVLWAVALFYAVVLAAKVAIGANLALFYDEATYWQASLRPGWGYLQTPVLTPLLIRAGTAVLGDTPLGVRLAFLLCAAMLPLAIYALARPLVGGRDGVLAAGVSLVMPITGLLGEAYMDAPMLLFLVLGLAAFERARRTGATAMWAAAGAFAALGFATHYRFAPFALGILAYLFLTRDGRRLWAAKGLWLMAAIAALGTVPMLAFNLGSDFGSFQFQVLERNPWRFQAKGLRFPLEQVLVVTPLLFAALAAAFVGGFRRARAGDAGAQFLTITAAVPIAFFAVLAPFADLERLHAHWPAGGYIPLFVLLPGTLRAFGAGGAARRIVAALVPASGAVAVVAGVFYLAASTWPGTLFPDSLNRYVRHQLVQWPRVATALTGAFDGGGAVVAASTYPIGSGLDFALRPRDGVFILEHAQNRRDGIWPQYVHWQLDEGALRQSHAGRAAAVVIEDKDFWFYSPTEVAFRQGLCATFAGLRPIGGYELPSAQKQFLFYAGTVRPAAASAAEAGPGRCAAVPAAYLARPKRGNTVAGTIDFIGWAIDDAVGVKSVEALIDGESAGTARYGVAEPRVRRFLPASTDPNHPRVGFTLTVDVSALAPGRHTAAIRVTAADGRVWEHGQRTVFVTAP